MASVAAQNAQKTAREKLLEWTSDPSHNSWFGTFASNIVSQLETCFVGTRRCLQRCREKMWENLFKLRASGRFKACWSSFLHESIGVPAACPIFFSMSWTTFFIFLLSSTTSCEIRADMIKIFTAVHLRGWKYVLSHPPTSTLD